MKPEKPFQISKTPIPMPKVKRKKPIPLPKPKAPTVPIHIPQPAEAAKSEHKELTKMQQVIDMHAQYKIARNEVLDLLCREQPNRRKATEVIVRVILRYNDIYTTKDDIKSEMWIFRAGIFVPQGRSEVREIVREILEEQYTSQLANEVLEKISTDTYVNPDVFFSHNYLDEVCVANGILNIHTRELKPFDPEKIFFSKLPVTYDPSKKCENITKHFKTVLKSPDDVKAMVELIGYGLLKENKFEKAFMFEGHGRNGKSKTIELIKRFFGIENCSAVTLQNMHDASFEVCELFGKHVNLAGDLSKDDLKSTGMFKKLIGRDLISANRKFLRPLVFVNFSKMIFACNELPRTYDLTLGFWSKWLIFSFPYVFVDKLEYESLPDKTMYRLKNPNIIEKLTKPDELSGLLNLALNSLGLIIKNNCFSLTQGTSEIMNFWIRRSDSFQAFALDCLEESQNGYLAKSELRKIYSKYCKVWGLKGASDTSIKITIQELYGADDARKTEGDEQIHVWTGIKLKDDYPNFLQGKSQGSQGSQGFSPYLQKCNFGLEAKKYGNPDYPDFLCAVCKSKIEGPPKLLGDKVLCLNCYNSSIKINNKEFE